MQATLPFCALQCDENYVLESMVPTPAGLSLRAFSHRAFFTLRALSGAVETLIRVFVFGALHAFWEAPEGRVPHPWSSCLRLLEAVLLIFDGTPPILPRIMSRGTAVIPSGGVVFHFWRHDISPGQLFPLQFNNARQ